MTTLNRTVMTFSLGVRPHQEPSMITLIRPLISAGIVVPSTFQRRVSRRADDDVRQRGTGRGTHEPTKIGGGARRNPARGGRGRSAGRGRGDRRFLATVRPRR